MTVPFYDVDDVWMHTRRDLHPGFGGVGGFVRGHEAGEGLTSSLLSGRPLCAEADPEVFFPQKGDNESSEAAKRVCRSCECLISCREHSLWERYGIWGGLSEKDRRVLRRRRKAEQHRFDSVVRYNT